MSSSIRSEKRRRFEFASFLFFFLSSALLAMPVYPISHELGHYIIACSFDCSKVEKLNILLTWNSLFTPRGNMYVKFREDYPFGYPTWQSILIAIGGFLAEATVILLGSLAFLLIRNFRLRQFLFGFIFWGMLETTLVSPLTLPSALVDFAVVLKTDFGLSGITLSGALLLIFTAILVLWLILAVRLIEKTKLEPLATLLSKIKKKARW
ncbi:MAG: hypothetical protein J7L23_00820 [Candidatus Diapherotrites archaeon]|nr:hypothetical protein [Candidatus Diapherotrites archaeon]